MSNGALVLADDQISGDKVNGGTIGSITIGQLTGAMDANNQVMSNVNITSGSISGTTISDIDISVGAGDVLDVSAGTFVTSSAQKLGILQGANNNVDIGEFDMRAQTLTADGLTSGRVVFAGVNGVLSDDADLSFSGDTLTATRIGSFTAAGAIDFNVEVLTNVNVDSGTIDNTTINDSDVTVGAGRTLDVSAGTFALADDQLSGDKINGGTIDTVTIGTLSGAMDANNQAMTNVNIDSGQIDGTDITIGAGNTLDVSAGTLTLADAQIDTSKLDTPRLIEVMATGTDAENGAAVVTALTTAQGLGVTVNTPVVVQLGPGVFDLTNATLDLSTLSGITLRGYGREATLVVTAVSGGPAVLLGKDNTLADVHVRNTEGDGNAVKVDADATERGAFGDESVSRLLNVRAELQGTANLDSAVVAGVNDMMIENSVIVNNTGGVGNNFGIIAQFEVAGVTNPQIRLKNSTVHVAAVGTGARYGIFAEGSSGSSL